MYGREHSGTQATQLRDPEPKKRARGCALGPDMRVGGVTCAFTQRTTSRHSIGVNVLSARLVRSCFGVVVLR